MRTDIMLDIETLGTSAGCQVLSVGVVAFEHDRRRILSSTHWPLDTEQQCKKGLIADPDTLQWWREQSAEAWEAATRDPREVRSALEGVGHFFKTWSGPDTQVWSQGNNFDMPILGHLFRAYGLDEPWQFWACRDTRTAYAEHGFDPKPVQRVDGTHAHHTAVGDCLHQIECLRQARAWGNRSWLTRAVDRVRQGGVL